MHVRRLVAVFVIFASFVGASSADEQPEVRNGLNAEIYSGRSFETLLSKRIDPNLQFFWGLGAPAEGMPADNFSIRWTGWICAPQDAQYKIIFTCDDGVRLWIDNQEILNRWVKRGSPEVSVALTKTPQTIRIDYVEVTHKAFLAMHWQPIGSRASHVIPSEAFFPDEASTQAKPKSKSGDRSGLVAEYFDTRFRRKLKTGHIDRAEAIWSTGSAMSGVPADAGARYTGFLVPPATGKYRLIAFSNDRLRLWIDGKPVMDADKKRKKTESAFIELDAGKPHAIRIDFVDDTGSGDWFLHWIPPKGSLEVSIPPECLFRTRHAAAKNPKAAPKDPKIKPEPAAPDIGEFIQNSIAMHLRLIPAGEFLMGSPTSERSHSRDEKQHQVRITKPFYIQSTEVTQEQYEHVMGVNPSRFKNRPRHPVENVGWGEAVLFCHKLSALPEEKSAGRVYRLPTEAEWEYACRAGTTTAYSFGDDPSQLGVYGWFGGNAGKTTHPVGEKMPNPWGLYDMHGNVYEWCQDRYGGYPDGPVTDPVVPASASTAVRRGGGWSYNAPGCRSSYRISHWPDRRPHALGFRVVLIPSEPADQ